MGTGDPSINKAGTMKGIREGKLAKNTVGTI
jgi:hypothetical protein